MATDRQGGQALLTLGGGVLLAVSVFLPWYGLTLTAGGAATAQQNLNSAAQQFGNSAFQNAANGIGNSFGSLVGHQLGTVSAHQALKYISIALLVLAGIAILVTMARLVGSTSSAQPRGLLALVGFAAAVCIVFRMVARPSPDADILAITLSWGAWLSLGSSLAIIVGDLWPSGADLVQQAPPSYPAAPPPSYPASLPPYPASPPPYPGGLSTPPRPPGWS